MSKIIRVLLPLDISKEQILQYWPTLTEKEAFVLSMRTGLKGADRVYKLREIAEILHRSSERVRGLEGQALRKIMNYVEYPRRGQAALRVAKQREEGGLLCM